MPKPDGLRFLIVEAQSDLRRTINGMLKGIDAVAVYSVATGTEGLEILQSQPVDFILCDWSSPELSGMELLKLVRSNKVTADLPFLMMSRKEQLSDNEYSQTFEAEVDGHLIKPLNQQEIEQKVSEVLKNREEHLESNVSIARAGAFTDVGAFDEAEAELEIAIQKKPDAPKVLVKSGNIYQEMGKDDKAKSCYIEAKSVDDRYVKAYDGLVEILEKEGNEDEAFELLQEAVKISPGNRDRQFKVAKALLAKGDEEGAHIAIHEAVGDQGDPAAINAAAAEFYLAAGRADLAEAEYAFALEADPENVHYFNRLGIAFRRQKKFKEAVENYRKALVVVKDDAVVYYNMALAMAEGGDRQQAVGALRRALVLNPGFKEAEKILSKLSPTGK